jgi:hypothetical protein
LASFNILRRFFTAFTALLTRAIVPVSFRKAYL